MKRHQSGHTQIVQNALTYRFTIKSIKKNTYWVNLLFVPLWCNITRLSSQLAILALSLEYRSLQPHCSRYTAADVYKS